MTVGDLRKRLEKYDDNDIVVSETRGDNYTSPSIYDGGYVDDRDEYDTYFDSVEEAIELEVPKENVKRRVMITGHS